MIDKIELLKRMFRDDLDDYFIFKCDKNLELCVYGDMEDEWFNLNWFLDNLVRSGFVKICSINSISCNSEDIYEISISEIEICIKLTEKGKKEIDEQKEIKNIMSSIECFLFDFEGRELLKKFLIDNKNILKKLIVNNALKK